MSVPFPAQAPPNHAGMLVDDFVFASIQGALDDSATAIPVDDVSQFPDNSVLAKAPLFLTIESDLAFPPTFEIVKLTSVNTLGLTLTVERGQQGTTARAHDDGTSIKGALTAAMIRLMRAAFTGSQVPPPDADVYVPGDRFIATGEGVQYTFHGGTFFTINDFSQSSTSGGYGSGSRLDYLPPVPQGYDNNSQMPRSSMPWTQITGGMGTPDGFDPNRSSSYAVVTATGATNQSCALLNAGSDTHQFAVHMTTGADGSVDAGVMFGATTDGRNGWYLSFVPGSPCTLHRVVNDVMTVVGAVGTDNVAANDAIYAMAILHNDRIDVWYQSSALGSSSYHESPDGHVTSYYNFASYATDTDPRGSNMGLLANSAACATDPYLCWTYLESVMCVGQDVPRGYGVGYPFSSTDGTSTPVDQPTTVDMRHNKAGAMEWQAAIGTFGIVTNATLGNQQAQYVSDAVGDAALLLTDLRSRNFDVSFEVNPPTDPVSDWGLWLRGSTDGQNGLVLRFQQYGVGLHAVVDGVVEDVVLGYFAVPTPLNGSFQLRVSISGEFVTLDDLNYGGFGTQERLGFALIPGLYRDFGGTAVGWRLFNSNALGDSTLGLTGFGVNTTDQPAGWQGEPTFRGGYGEPTMLMPFGSLYINYQSRIVYLSKGDGFWVPTTPAFSKDPPDTSIRVRDGAMYLDLNSFQIWVGANGIWNQVGAGQGMRGRANLGFHGDFGESPAVGDFMESDGALLFTVIDGGGGQWITDQPQLTPWPSNGSDNTLWVPTGDASINTSTGVATLTTSASLSNGLIVANRRIAFDAFHVRFTVNIVKGGGFSFGFLTDDSILAANNTAPLYAEWAGGPLDRSDASFGAAAVNGVKLGFPIGTYMAYTGLGFETHYPAYLNTIGTHVWDIRIEVGPSAKPSEVNVVLYRDGTPVAYSYCTIDSLPVFSGYPYFAAGTPSSAATGPVSISNFSVIQAQRSFRVRSGYAPEDRIPLMLNSPWVQYGNVTPSWSVEGDRIRLHGSIYSGAAATQPFKLEARMKPLLDEFYLPVAHRSSAGVVTVKTMHVSSTTSAMSCFLADYATGEQVYLDSISWPRLQQ